MSTGTVEGLERELSAARRNVFLLMFAQALLASSGPIVFSIGGLAGYNLLGADKSLATAPLTGFNIGADDYISKPFSIREVLARVKAVLRRVESNQELNEVKELRHENLVMSLNNKKVTLGGDEVSFTKKEFEILKLFLENKNRVFTREEILSRVWSDEVVVLDRTIDVNITRLRKKIGDYGKQIITRLGYGYCFEG